MPRKDKYHEAVRVALQKEGWTITDDPLTVPTPGLDFFIDLGAERDIIGAEKGSEKIAVEIKSLLASFSYDFYQALGQYLIYRLAMNKKGWNYMLWLAIPKPAFDDLNKKEIIRESWKFYTVHLLVFEEDEKKIHQWLNH